MAFLETSGSLGQLFKNVDIPVIGSHFSAFYKVKLLDSMTLKTSLFGKLRGQYLTYYFDKKLKTLTFIRGILPFYTKEYDID
jgi:hypothetical protein